jgi:exosortase family protein XrtM
MIRATVARLVGFIILFGAMYFALASLWSDGLSYWVIDVGTVKPAAWIGRFLTGNQAIVASGAHLRAPDGSINVLFGCEGSDVLMLLVAALLVAQSSWSRRLWGLLVGAAVVFAVNQARVLALFFAVRQRPAWFGPIHGLIGPMVVIVVVTAFFLSWLRWAQVSVDGDGAT